MRGAACTPGVKGVGVTTTATARRRKITVPRRQPTLAPRALATAASGTYVRPIAF
jgi:hypothetical protein